MRTSYSPICSIDCIARVNFLKISGVFYGFNDKAPKHLRPRRAAAVLLGDNIDRLTLYELYNWKCILCKEEIPWDKRVPHPRAATLEHIIPITKGGQHIWENVAPAHLMCNSSKSDSDRSDLLAEVSYVLQNGKL